MIVCDRCGNKANHRVFICAKVGAKDLCPKCYKELDDIIEDHNVYISKWFVLPRKEKKKDA